MLELPYSDQEFDVTWAEGSIYNMGFAKGLQGRPFCATKILLGGELLSTYFGAVGGFFAKI